MTREQLELELANIEKIIEDGFGDEACEKYISASKDIEGSKNETSSEVKADFYAAFAYFLFRVSEYNECIKMYLKAQSYGYSKEEIMGIIYEAFVEPNLKEFKEIYNMNIEQLRSKGCISKGIEFEELPFWLIPTATENEYYIYDKKEKLIEDKFIFNDLMDASMQQVGDELSDFLILEDWNWNKVRTYSQLIRKYNNRVYIVAGDIRKMLACFQAGIVRAEELDRLLIFDGFYNMKEYFINCCNYIPRNIVDLMNSSIRAKRAIDEIHNYRIHNNISNRDNVLLTICIPSYNRGDLAYKNIMHNLETYYDEEIEIVISNNGTKNETITDYEMISNIKDSRLKYYEFDQNQGFAINICKTIEIANGRFVVMLSDEDLIDFSNLPPIMHELANEENLAIIRAYGNKQAKPPTDMSKRAGEEAMLTYMLSSNYMSGIILNTKMLRKNNCTEYIKRNLNNEACFNYPHMVWELILCQYGSVRGTKTILINEGEAKKTEVEDTEIGTNVKASIPYYASIEGRLDQHRGFLDVFKDLEICKNNFRVLRKMYIRLCNKTLFLAEVSIVNFYILVDEDTISLLDDTLKFCINCLDEIYEEKSRKNGKEYYDDLNRIIDRYEIIKKQI